MRTATGNLTGRVVSQISGDEVNRNENEGRWACLLAERGLAGKCSGVGLEKAGRTRREERGCVCTARRGRELCRGSSWPELLFGPEDHWIVIRVGRNDSTADTGPSGGARIKRDHICAATFQSMPAGQMHGLPLRACQQHNQTTANTKRKASKRQIGLGRPHPLHFSRSESERVLLGGWRKGSACCWSPLAVLVCYYQFVAGPSDGNHQPRARAPRVPDK